MNGDCNPRLVFELNNRNGDLVCGDLRTNFVADEVRDISCITSEQLAMR